MKYGVLNTRAEEIINRVKAMARRAYGFRNRKRFKTAIMYYTGNLEVSA